MILIFSFGGIFVFLKFSTMHMYYLVNFKSIKNYHGAISPYTFSCLTYKFGLQFNCLAHGSWLKRFPKILSSQIQESVETLISPFRRKYFFKKED